MMERGTEIALQGQQMAGIKIQGSITLALLCRGDA